MFLDKLFKRRKKDKDAAINSEELNAAEESSAAEKSGASEVSALDRELERMLESDRKADEDFNSKTVSGLVTTKSIFDGSLETIKTTGANETQWENYAKKKELALPVMDTGLSKPRNFKERIHRMSVPQLSIGAAVIVAVIVGLGFGAFFIAQNIVTASAEKEVVISQFTPVTQPLNVTNDANFIFIGETVALGTEQFTLSKISVGTEATMAYFSQNLDLERYSFKLTDQTQNLYMRRRYGIIPDEASSSVLEFEPLRSNVVFLTLTIHDNETDGEISFNYRFTEMPGTAPPSYVNEPIPLLEEDGSAYLNISRAVISNTATEIFYNLNFEGSGQISFGEGGPLIQLRQGSRLIPLLGASPAETRFEEQDTTLGKLTFAPVPSPERKADLIFNDLFYTFNLLGRTVDAERLFYYKDNGPQTIYTGNHSLVLEAMGIQSTVIILVGYAEDKDGGRVQAKLTSAFSFIKDGEVTEIEGKVYTGTEGFDIVYDLSDVYSDFIGVPLTDCSVSLDTVEYSIPQLTASMDLSQTAEQPERWIGTAQPFIRESFLTRLAYKSHQRRDITGFASEILNDRALMRFYQPAGVDEMPEYNARVVSGAMVGDITFIGIVEEEWTLGSDVDLTQQHLIHKVVCERVNGQWLITGDEIIV